MNKRPVPPRPIRNKGGIALDGGIMGAKVMTDGVPPEVAIKAANILQQYLSEVDPNAEPSDEAKALARANNFYTCTIHDVDCLGEECPECVAERNNPIPENAGMPPGF